MTQDGKKFFEGFDFARTNYDQDGEIPELYKRIPSNKPHSGIPELVILFTKTNPVRERRKYNPTLELSNFGLQESDRPQKLENKLELAQQPLKKSLHI